MCTRGSGGGNLEVNGARTFLGDGRAEFWKWDSQRGENREYREEFWGNIAQYFPCFIQQSTKS